VIENLQKCRETQFSYFRGKIKREKGKGNIIVDENQTKKKKKKKKKNPKNYF
jgi:hypothetical protein